ncbi:MAG TPA: branched-chain amino acid ABC transporter substrate-binding protein [Acidimicrobiia bacterium]|jgi:branched-chain amino acid transport system substrate-binding protein
MHARRFIFAISASLLGSVVFVGCGSSAATGSAGSEAQSCTGAIAVMASAGSAGSTQPAQMNWARVALDTFNAEQGSSFTINPSNVFDETQRAGSEAARLADDPTVVGVVGPVTSSVTEIAGPIFDAAGLAYVSPSATTVSLTGGHLQHFFRVVANNNEQAVAIAHLVSSSLHPKTVLVVDDSEVYSTNLTQLIAHELSKDHLTIDRASVDVGQPDYSDVVSKIGQSTNVVVMPFVDPGDAQRLADQIHATGKSPSIVGGDAMFSLNDFDVAGAYVPTYAPDVSKMKDGAATVKLYGEIFGDLAPFAATAYVAMQTVATAALATCRNGQASREGVAQALPGIRIPSTLLGYPVSFDAHHELVHSRYWMYRIEGGSYQQISP